MRSTDCRELHFNISQQVRFAYLKKKKLGEALRGKAAHIHFLGGAVSHVGGLVFSRRWACGSVFSQGRKGMMNFCKGGRVSHQSLHSFAEELPRDSGLTHRLLRDKWFHSTPSVPWPYSTLFKAQPEFEAVLQSCYLGKPVGQNVAPNVHAVGLPLDTFFLEIILFERFQVSEGKGDSGYLQGYMWPSLHTCPKGCKTKDDEGHNHIFLKNMIHS